MWEETFSMNDEISPVYRVGRLAYRIRLVKSFVIISVSIIFAALFGMAGQ